ncbi:DMT family transporter [Metabacillus herbersteinensis]|uniref:DMT family transporter n=1 Tax=Metabacillus herbersteinensis TaxID=283816 RepID=A0ABV6GBB3_9BACI
MKNKWLIVYIAALFEVMWVSGLKHAGTSLEWTGTIIAILISFGLLIRATNFLPVSTVYAVFTGLGAAGTVLIEILFFGEPLKLLKILLIVLLVAGVVGLKVISSGKQEVKES